jgi:hypothetical protein
MVSLERMQQIMRNRRDATTQRGVKACQTRRSIVSPLGGDEMVRIGTLLQQRVLQVLGFPKAPCERSCALNWAHLSSVQCSRLHFFTFDQKNFHMETLNVCDLTLRVHTLNSDATHELYPKILLGYMQQFCKYF